MCISIVPPSCGASALLSQLTLFLFISLLLIRFCDSLSLFFLAVGASERTEREKERGEKNSLLWGNYINNKYKCNKQKKNYRILCAYHGLKFLSSAFEWKYEIDSFVAIWTKLTKRSRVLHIVCVAQCSISKMKSSCWSSAIVQRSLFILFRFIRTFCINNDDGCLSFCIGALSSPVYSSSSHKNYTHAHRRISKIIIKFWKHSKHQIGYHICIVYVCSVPESVCDSISYMPLLRNMFWLDRQRMMFSSNIPAMWR